MSETTVAPPSFTNQIRQAIKDSGWSKYRLARASGLRLHESELSRFVSGQANLGLDKINIIAELIGMEVDLDLAAKQSPSLLSEELAEVGARCQKLQLENDRLRQFVDDVRKSIQQFGGDNWFLNAITSAVRKLDDTECVYVSTAGPSCVAQPLDDSSGADGPGQS